MSKQLAVGAATLIASTIIVIMVAKFLIFWMLPCIVLIIKKFILITFGWPLEKNLPKSLWLGLSSFCTIVISVYCYHATSLVDGAIMVYVFLFVIGVSVHVFSYFTASTNATASKQTNECNGDDDPTCDRSHFDRIALEKLRKRYPPYEVAKSKNRTKSF